MYLLGVQILWKSRLQRTVALSSSEAEYYALSEAAKEIKFLVQLMETIGMKLIFPIIVYVDNVKAIFMAENNTATQRTRHIDARYHFVRKYILEGYIKIQFVRSEDNYSDVFTKNVKQDVYQRHYPTYLSDRTHF